MTLTEALATLNKAGRIRDQWLDGMLVAERRVPNDWATTWMRFGDRWLPYHGTHYGDDPSSDALVVTNSPATVGCLLALLREAERDPLITTRGGPEGWWTHMFNEDAWGTDSASPTEGEAIAAALIALGAP